jgi:hypothetical protein
MENGEIIDLKIIDTINKTNKLKTSLFEVKILFLDL